MQPLRVIIKVISRVVVSTRKLFAHVSGFTIPGRFSRGTIKTARGLTGPVRGVAKPVLPIVLAVMATACLSDHTERVADVPPPGWNTTDTVWVPYLNSDTVSRRELSVILRYDKSVREEKIALDIHTMRPDSAVFSERVTLNIATYGVLGQDHYEAVIPYRRFNVLERPGVYRFGFSPVEPLAGITAVGVDM